MLHGFILKTLSYEPVRQLYLMQRTIHFYQSLTRILLSNYPNNIKCTICYKDVFNKIKIVCKLFTSTQYSKNHFYAINNKSQVYKCPLHIQPTLYQTDKVLNFNADKSEVYCTHKYLKHVTVYWHIMIQFAVSFTNNCNNIS